MFCIWWLCIQVVMIKASLLIYVLGRAIAKAKEQLELSLGIVSQALVSVS